MIDLTRITSSEANKIECALIMLEKEIIEKEKAFAEAASWDILPEKSQNVMKSNAQWWKEIHELIFN